MHCYERNWQTVGVKVWNSTQLAKSSNICTAPCEIQFSIQFIIESFFYVVNFGMNLFLLKNILQQTQPAKS